MDKAHDVSNLTVSGKELQMEVDGAHFAIDLASVSKRLATASESDCENVEISATGYGLYWPTLDEDLSVDGLIKNARSVRVAREGI